MGDSAIIDDGEKKARASGRAMVRDQLLAPLAALRRPRGVEAADYDRLADKLAYMTPEAVAGLTEFMLVLVGGGKPPAHGKTPFCPVPDLIRVWAYALQKPPARDSDYVRSVMRSNLGHIAYEMGYHVELFRHARRFGPPPQRYLTFKLQDEARENLRQLDLCRERRDARCASPDQARWLDEWQSDRAEAEAMVLDGEARRAAVATDEGATE